MYSYSDELSRHILFFITVKKKQIPYSYTPKKLCFFSAVVKLSLQNSHIQSVLIFSGNLSTILDTYFSNHTGNKLFAAN